MECYVHPEAAAVGNCVSCGRGICKDCAIETGNKLVCRNCLATGNMSASPAAKEHDPNTVFIIELVGGFFGLLGLGYFYVGRTNDGLLRLLVWFGYNLVAWIAIVLLMAILVGFVCAVFQILIQIAVPVWSAMTIKNELERG